MQVRYQTPLSSYQVLQRDSDDFTRVLLTSTNEVIVLPTGGPYTIDSASEIYVGDLFILAGQSNMEGYGDLNVDIYPPIAGVHSFQTREEWAIAEDPLHWLDESPYPIDHTLHGRPKVPDNPIPRDPNRKKGVGPGLAFGKQYYANSGGVPVGLIPSAHGGTSMQQWDHNLASEGGRSLYGAMLERFKKVGGKVRGILWYQGESDTFEVSDALAYEGKMEEFIAAVRKDMKDPNLGFWLVQLGRVIWYNSEEPWNIVRMAQRRLPQKIGGDSINVVAALDLELDDHIHIGSISQRELGRRLAAAALNISGPILASVKREGDEKLRLSYSGVSGNLTACGIPSGFSIRTEEGKLLPIVYRTTLDKDEVILHLINVPETTAKMFLWYGYGNDPYCNITDADGSALLAFGSVEV